MAKRSAPRSNPPVDRPADAHRSGEPGKKKPVHTIRYGKLKAAIWMNEGQTGPFHNVTFSRSYRDGQNTWHDASSFNLHDLPLLAKLTNDCHSWITWQERKAKESADNSKPQQ